MRIYYNCKNCKSENSFVSFTDSRYDLSKDKGENPVLSCSNCKEDIQYHVNDLFTRKSKVITITCVILFILGLGIILGFVPSYGWRALILLAIPFGILIIPIAADEKRVSRFNSYSLPSGWNKKN